MSRMSLDEKKDWLQSKGLSLPCSMYARSAMSWLFEGQSDEFVNVWHDAWKDNLSEVIWPGNLAPILENTKLDRLTVVFWNSRCPAGCCLLHAKPCAAPHFANGMVKHMSLYGLPPWTAAEQESFKEGDREITVIVLPTVPDQDGEEDEWRRYALQAVEQIARWTSA